MKKISLFLAIIVVLFPSCLSVFDLSMKNEFDDANVDFKKVQFYNKNKIILKRVLEKEEINTTSGIVRFENGKFYHEIIIKNNTPCVVDSIDDNENIINVRFEQGANKVLPFKFLIDRYKLTYLPGNSPHYYGKLEYDGKIYQVIEGSDAYLTMKRSDKLVERTEKKVLEGIKVE